MYSPRGSPKGRLPPATSYSMLKAMGTDIHVNSETGRLKAVLLHRPGRELESLTPQYLDSMLFEDIPFLAQMQQEHDQFAHLLQEHGCQVWYVKDLLEEVLTVAPVRTSVMEHLIGSSQLNSPSLRSIIEEHLAGASPADLAGYCIAGLLKAEVDAKVRHKTLSYFIRDAYPYYIPPLPNLYFTRDPATVVGGGIWINSMKTEARRRESWLLALVASHHPLFAQNRVHGGSSRMGSIEGGDVLVLNKDCVAVGSSARTDVGAIESFATRMLDPVELGGEGLKSVLVLHIPHSRAYMHVDTVFTMVDHDAFCVFPGIEPSIQAFTMTKRPDGMLEITAEGSLKQALKRALNVPAVELIRSGGNDSIAAAREQWNDSTNTLAIAPRTVVTYSRNVVTNETLERHGIRVFTIGGSELVRGRGGPRCMSMPLWREEL